MALIKSPLARKRMAVVTLGALVLGLGTLLILNAMSGAISYYVEPSDITEEQKASDTRFKLGGIVAEDSVQYGEGLHMYFDVTDFKATIKVHHEGPPPDLFRDCQGVILFGTFNEKGGFEADRILAKHDENYTPKELADLPSCEEMVS